MGATPRRSGRLSVASPASSSGYEAKTHAAIERDAAKQAESFSVGDTVDHKVFGRGRVTKVQGDAITIKFVKSGQEKKLLKGYAPIVRIEG